MEDEHKDENLDELTDDDLDDIDDSIEKKVISSQARISRQREAVSSEVYGQFRKG